MIYVDDYQRRCGQVTLCHMMSDSSLDELHAFARRLHLGRKWFHDATAPHYYLSHGKRAEAVSLGAAELQIREDREEWRRVVACSRMLKSMAVWNLDTRNCAVEADADRAVELSTDTIAELCSLDVFFEEIRNHLAGSVHLDQHAVHQRLIEFATSHGWIWKPELEGSMWGRLWRGQSRVDVEVLVEGIALHAVNRSEVVMTAY